MILRIINMSINKTKLLLLFKRILCITLLMTIVVMCNCNTIVKAAMLTNSPDYITSGYDLQMAYIANNRSHGGGGYNLSGDISKMDCVVIPNGIGVTKCCDNPMLPRKAYAQLIIDGTVVYKNDEYTICESPGGRRLAES